MVRIDLAELLEPNIVAHICLLDNSFTCNHIKCNNIFNYRLGLIPCEYKDDCNEFIKHGECMFKHTYQQFQILLDKRDQYIQEEKLSAEERLLKEEEIIKHKLKTMDKQDMCSICFESFENDKLHETRSLSCLHVFHNACIDQWFNKNKNQQCPLCREKQTDDDYYDLGNDTDDDINFYTSSENESNDSNDDDF